MLDHPKNPKMKYEDFIVMTLLAIVWMIMLPSHPAPDRAASRSSILSVAFFGTMMHLRGASLTQRRLFWPEEFLFSSEALNFRAPLS